MWHRPRLPLSGVLLAIPLVAVAMSLACVDSPTTSTPTTTLPSCQLENSAKITFENRSNTNKTYDVVWDGSKLTTIAPTQKSTQYSVEAGVTHSLQFKFTNTGQAACNVSHPILVVCTAHTFSCTG